MNYKVITFILCWTAILVFISFKTCGLVNRNANTTVSSSDTTYVHTSDTLTLHDTIYEQSIKRVVIKSTDTLYHERIVYIGDSLILYNNELFHEVHGILVTVRDSISISKNEIIHDQYVDAVIPVDTVVITNTDSILVIQYLQEPDNRVNLWTGAQYLLEPSLTFGLQKGRWEGGLIKSISSQAFGGYLKVRLNK